MTADLRLWHGGVPGLRVGDLIEPGNNRPTHPGCAYCAARDEQANGGAAPVIDPLAQQTDRVYATTSRAYARHYASLWGRGDLYRVEAVGEAERSAEDSIETWHAPTFRVLAVVERAVLLTWTQRRALNREWAAADAAMGWAAS